jgi:outer membrane lipoprotein LolB
VLSWRRGCLLLAVCLIAGCATPRGDSGLNASESLWRGRLGLQVEGSNDVEQSFSASFELRGNAQNGQLKLFNPLGGTLAVLMWQPGQAMLKDASNTSRSFDSLDALSAQATGTALPIAALFDWLGGRDTPVDGWQADLSQTAQGRLMVKRFSPLPQARLRVVLEP